MKPRIQKIMKSKSLDKDWDLSRYLHYHSYSHVPYILTTANNWAGPIKNFKLRIKKDKPSTLVSLCWDGLKKVSDLEFHGERKTFLPKSDLNVLFIHER